MNSQDPRPELILAALLYLVTAYRRARCPGLASCIARHFDCLARHPDTHRVVREIAFSSASEWQAAACEGARANGAGSALRLGLH